MKYKKGIIVLLVISILANILMFYNIRKYKSIVKDEMQYKLSNVFSSADSIDISLDKMINQRTADSDGLSSIFDEYEKMIINLYDLRDIANKINHKNKGIIDCIPYSDFQRDIDRFISDIKKANPNSKAALTNDDMKFLYKYSTIVYKIKAIYKKYSYTEKDMTYIKMDQWQQILKELNTVMMLH